MSDFINALQKRRSVYGLGRDILLKDSELKELLAAVLKNAPTAFNMQNTRMVLLLGQDSKELWSIALDAVQAVAPREGFARTEQKIAGFAAGHGTILFFNDEAVNQKMMEENPLYSQHFPLWQLQHNGMLQHAVWTALAEKGIGASLQHYNPLIDDKVKSRWQLPREWTLLAQMPFGSITGPADEKTFEPIEKRFKVFGE